ncbi:MAG: hypothetical protein HOP29_00980 [Phycisphaerales bacterium]|nr:hypothetical protein [Phycisphaerales bacterium]
MALLKDLIVDAYVTTTRPAARRVRASDRTNSARSTVAADADHLQAALNWLCRAQDVGDDDGVAAMYSLLQGWVASYPETTGYIIPSFFDCAANFADGGLRRRAIAMAEWLRRCQRKDGAFCGLFADRPAPPRVFNTGQAMFGLLRAARETGDDSFLSSATSAAEWLIAAQDKDGAWRRHTLNNIPHAYNVRTAWALAQLAQAVNDERLLGSAIRAADWTVGRQCSTGWFAENTFNRDDRLATLHTIAYSMRGLLEVAAIADRKDYTDCALAAALALRDIWNRDRIIAGAYDSNWSQGVNWRCLPGECQLAIVWLRLDQVLGRKEFAEAAHELLQGVKAMQFMNVNNADLLGGLTASWPVDAPYERYCLVNWGPKFLIDALLLKGRTDGGHPTG